MMKVNKIIWKAVRKDTLQIKKRIMQYFKTYLMVPWVQTDGICQEGISQYFGCVPESLPSLFYSQRARHVTG